jgi:chromosome segregation ATPase
MDMAASPNADTTISPLLPQIHALEEQVGKLQEQLQRANDDIDDKLALLESSGSGSVSLARELGQARERAARLENDLERLLGTDGLVETLKLRLAKTRCPKCSTSFDVNDALDITTDFDRHILHFKG